MTTYSDVRVEIFLNASGISPDNRLTRRELQDILQKFIKGINQDIKNKKTISYIVVSRVEVYSRGILP